MIAAKLRPVIFDLYRISDAHRADVHDSFRMLISEFAFQGFPHRIVLDQQLKWECR